MTATPDAPLFSIPSATASFPMTCPYPRLPCTMAIAAAQSLNWQQIGLTMPDTPATHTGPEIRMPRLRRRR